MHEVARFLRGFPPFEAADDDALDALVAATEIEFFAEGSLLLAAGQVNEGVAHVVRTGHVELISDGRVFDVVGPGELVGVPSLVSGLPTGVDARAAEDVLTYRVPAAALLPLLEELAGRQGWSWGTPFAVRYCRVGVLNDIGDVLDPAVVVLLIGERPGLGTAESLSAYLAYRPRPGCTDADRNLVSNIHARGTTVAEAAPRIVAYIAALMAAGRSGVAVKEPDAPPRTLPNRAVSPPLTDGRS